MNHLMRSGFGENLRRGGVLIGALGDDPPAAATPPALPAAGTPAAAPAPAASPPPAAGPAAASPPAAAGGKSKDDGPMATFNALPTVAKVGIGVGVAAVVISIGAAIVAAAK
jgi:hypothetical protein